VLTAARRIRVAPEQAQDERDGGGQRRARAVQVRVPARRATLERGEDVEELTRIGAGRDDTHRRPPREVGELGLPESEGLEASRTPEPP
jgi:hypothetical protein